MCSPSFARFWQVDLTRECLLSFLTKDDLRALRLVSHGFSDTIAPMLFHEVKLEFNSTSFSRHAKLAALSRIGHHIKDFTFHLPHNDDTFLPPLLHPDTIEELSFRYDPHVYPSLPSTLSSTSSESKYGSWALNDLLVRQYPVLFHAATNTQSFVRAISTMPYLRHLQISCPGQRTSQRHRRAIVDYALMSLRIAVEQANPEHLETLTLDPIHPSATFYLRPQLSIGSLPSSSRVWRRLKRLNIAMDSFETSTPGSTTDHLKILHSYLSSFPGLETFSFKWLGDHKGPSPLSLSTEPCKSRPSSLAYSACISHDDKRSSPASKGFSSLRPLRFRNLKSMRLENATFDAIQASTFIMTHRRTLHEFHYEHCRLRSGTWDDALSPLTRISGNEDWKSQLRPNHRSLSSASTSTSTTRSKSSLPSLTDTFSLLPVNQIIDVPIMLAPDEEKPDPLEFVVDRMWAAKEIAFFDAADDSHSFLSSWSRRRKGVDAIRRFGARLGIAYSVRDSDVAMESVRKLLKGCRVVGWR